ncbi:hypothetical protein SLNWT_5098 [Streptomyces albus]|uniref:Uncharacterized protein n=1 Tax=Streptomyces albus (strain ATCC 21838 / DSM 41398 / FERM P-419 / JCM 4703 / NBRC 107858) TaxID=1081613 RepID=A0A0B5EUN1_STRA4|nr:hypothetical protein SLNWT_5098 [Streptomyces albus]AOU79777.1 hypothetical protein SLNHY_5086 [Streptomyces albus]AYN35498.1 hypothetical protein DUI70_5004 [Streptomyces albus]
MSRLPPCPSRRRTVRSPHLPSSLAPAGPVGPETAVLVRDREVSGGEGRRQGGARKPSGTRMKISTDSARRRRSAPGRPAPRA